jgi:hypothetical protein
MRYLLRTIVGLGLIVAGFTAVSYAVFELLQIGTCASGGPYVSARQCPPGTERIMLAIFPAVLLMLLGVWLYNGRGRAPGSDRDSRGGGLLILWSGLFLGIAFACFWGVWGPDANPGPGGKTGGLIVGFIFVPMGLGGLIPLIASMFDRSPPQGTIPLGRPVGSDGSTVVRSAPRPIGATSIPSATAPRPPAASADKVASLERLDKLRRDGAISETEFERLKAEVLGG